MGVIRNKNTSQFAMTQAGLTGAQSEFFVPASRLYLKAVDAAPAPVVGKSAGKTPTGWNDMGIMDGNAKVTYTKNLNKILAGLDKRLSQVYDDQTTGTFEINLTQYDDVVMQNVTGLTPYEVQTGSIVRFNIGSESIVQSAILLVSQNKVDGKEVQYYNPSAFMSFSIEETNNAQMIKVTIDMPTFTVDNATGLFAQTWFHKDLPSAF